MGSAVGMRSHQTAAIPLSVLKWAKKLEQVVRYTEKHAGCESLYTSGVFALKQPLYQYDNSVFRYELMRDFTSGRQT